MNKNIFYSILILICLGGMISIVYFASSGFGTANEKIDYAGVPTSDITEKLSINGFKHTTVTETSYEETIDFFSNVKVVDGEKYIYSVTVDETTLNLADTFKIGDVIGSVNTNVYCAENDGMVLDIISIENAFQLILTNQSALIFEIVFMQEYLHMISYSMEVRIQLNDGHYVFATVRYIDYLQASSAGIRVIFDILDSKQLLFPDMQIKAQLIVTQSKSALMIPALFLGDYNIENKVYEIFVVDGTTVKPILIKTYAMVGDRLIIEGDEIYDGLIIYIKGLN